MTDDLSGTRERCAICGWPLADTMDGGCVRGSCSQRPLPKRFYDPARVKVEYGDYAPLETDPYVPDPRDAEIARLVQRAEALEDDIGFLLAGCNRLAKHADAAEKENARLLTLVEVWKEAYAGTDHAQEQRAWQHERDSMVKDKEARAAENARLRAALVAVVQTGDDCPACDRGVLRHPENGHWPACPFGRAQALLAESLAPPLAQEPTPKCSCRDFRSDGHGHVRNPDPACPVHGPLAQEPTN